MELQYPDADESEGAKRSRGFVATINNYTDDDIERLKSLECKYLCYGKEIAPSTGTPHLQVYMYFKEAKSWTCVRSKIVNWWLATAKGNSMQNREYCMKEGDFFEVGELPRVAVKSGERYEVARALAKEGKLDEIEPELFIRYHSSLVAIKESAVVTAPVTLEGTCFGEWKWGPPGTGKSHDARSENVVYYLKSVAPNRMNFWCDYEGEECVLVEDIDASNGMRLAYYIKIWCDKYPFRAAKLYGKGSLIRPKKFVFTSNYSPDVLFASDPVLLAAIRRRVKVVRYCVLGEQCDGENKWGFGQGNWNVVPNPCIDTASQNSLASLLLL